MGGSRILMLMRQKRWFRAVAASLALWFPLIVGEPSVIHACPEHGGVAQTPSAVMVHHHRAPGDSQPSHSHHDCSCISCCVCSVAAAASPAGPTTAFVVEIRDPSLGHSPVASRAYQAPEYSRPYTTGPPRA